MIRDHRVEHAHADHGEDEKYFGQHRFLD